MSPMDLICPNSPVWDGRRFSPCFENMVLCFVPNVVTIITVIVLGFTRRNDRNIQMNRLEKVFLLLLPSCGTFTSLCNMLLLVKNRTKGHIYAYHVWLLCCSQLFFWVTLMLLLKCKNWMLIPRNRIFSFWWVLKVLLEMSHLWTAVTSIKGIRCLTESSSILIELTLCVFISLLKVTLAPNDERTDDLEESLLPSVSESKKSPVKQKRQNILGLLWQTLAFKTVDSMLVVGVTRQLDLQDLVQLPSDLLPSYCHNELGKCWIDEQSRDPKHPSLFRAIFHTYGWWYLRLGLLKVLNDAIGFMGPLLLNRLIKFLQQGSCHYMGYSIAVSLGLSSIFKSFLDTQYTFNIMKLKLKLRAGIITTVYNKCLQVSLSEHSKFSKGEIQTFMSVDADRTVNLCNSFHDMWSLPLQIGVALYLLYTQVKFAFVSGVAITVLLIPVNKWISTMIASATEKMMKQKDERIRSAGELLSHIRTLKMYGWETVFANRIIDKRTAEVNYLATRKYLDAWCVFFWATTPTLFSLFTFGFFTLMGHSLDAATVFTCVALFNTLMSPLNSFPWVINGLIDALISIRRLSKYLSCPERDLQSVPPCNEQRCQYRPVHSCSLESGADTPESRWQMAIVFRDAYFAWSSSEDKEKDASLKQINLNLPQGSLIAVTGEVGSGKSSLLNSVLKEMCHVCGHLDSNGSFAYVSQIPWIMSGSVRDNILFGKEYDPRRYEEVLRACALDVDISLMIGGDMTIISEKGSNLSGGQRSRLALARAIYYGSDIFLLDDVLNAVDAHVARWILQYAVLGPLMIQKTRVLCTHNIQAISAADMVIVMDKGHVNWAGSSEDFLLSPYSAKSMQKDVNLSPYQVLEQQGSLNGYDNLKSLPVLAGENIDVFEGREISELETRKEGEVEFTTYKSYAAFCSWPIVIVICVSLLFMQASKNGNDMWLSYWVDTATVTKQSSEFYLVVLFSFCVVNSVLTLTRAFSFSYGGLRAAVDVHSKLLRNLINAPILFFDENPTGRILNRLSSDMYTIDDSLPFILNILLANFFNLFGIAIVLSYAQVLFLFLLIPFWCVYSKLQFYYRSTSRELRRLDSVCRSPIYASFTETLDGASTIRAFKTEEFFMSGFCNRVASYQQTSYSEQLASLWLSLRLQLLAAVVISFVALMAVVGCCSNFPLRFGTPGLVGLALSYASPVVSLLSSFLASFTETEKEMVSVERVLQFMDISQEEYQGSYHPHSAWPTEGKIEFVHVTLRYRPSLPPALNDVSFKIGAGTQIGIIGRTGAGKSSVINALFRLTPICNGHILVDGIDIADTGVRDLRSHLAVVPQSPFLFEGSLRDNLDPFGLASESKIWDILQKCHIRKEVEAAGGLDITINESGESSFSVGQRQLICLARALIRSSKVLCLDECTANVDMKTTSALHNTISNECRGMTVITIAHRISVVLNMDGIIIFDHGIVVEEGDPETLLKDESSRFSSFARASTM